MSQLVALSSYQIGSMDPIPLASVPRIDFPFGGILVRSIPNGLALTTGQVVYSQVTLITSGQTYSVIETSAAIQALS